MIRAMQMSADVLIWMTVGVALLGSEAFTGSFHLLFFGLSALLTAVMASIGVEIIWIQLVIFAVMSMVGVLLIRDRLVSKSPGFINDVHGRVTLSEDVPAGSEAVVQYQGVPWTAINVSTRPLLRGEQALVLRTEGIKLILEPVSATEVH